MIRCHIPQMQHIFACGRKPVQERAKLVPSSFYLPLQPSLASSHDQRPTHGLTLFDLISSILLA